MFKGSWQALGVGAVICMLVALIVQYLLPLILTTAGVALCLLVFLCVGNLVINRPSKNSKKDKPEEKTDISEAFKEKTK